MFYQKTPEDIQHYEVYNHGFSFHVKFDPMDLLNIFFVKNIKNYFVLTPFNVFTSKFCYAYTKPKVNNNKTSLAITGAIHITPITVLLLGLLPLQIYAVSEVYCIHKYNRAFIIRTTFNKIISNKNKIP